MPLQPALTSKLDFTEFEARRFTIIFIKIMQVKPALIWKSDLADKEFKFSFITYEHIG